MPALTECPHCHRRWPVEDEALGVEVSCPSCQARSVATSIGLPPGLRRPHTVLVLMLATLALAVFGIFGPFAWWIARADLKRMERGEMDPAGMKSARLGVKLGKIGTIKFGVELVLIFSIVAIILAIAVYATETVTILAPAARVG